jgi:hypothetical protein
MTIDAVLSANRAFYHAFATRDLDAMDRIWARTTAVACIHPGARPVFGRSGVMASWREILSVGRGGPRIEVRGERALLLGGTALVLCEEVLGAGVLAASNLFVIEDGNWRMIHHQAGPLAIETPRPVGPGPTLH